VTTVQPLSRFGVLDLDEAGSVKQFKEKPQVEGWISIGYFIFEPAVFGYIDGDETVLEEGPLRRLAADEQIAAYPHTGFWQPMDTYRESQMLNEMWDGGTAPWRTW
jgi:glucose-1-phosphate cytidylyltransferase